MRKSFKSNLVLAVVLVLESKGLFYVLSTNRAVGTDLDSYSYCRKDSEMPHHMGLFQTI